MITCKRAGLIVFDPKRRICCVWRSHRYDGEVPNWRYESNSGVEQLQLPRGMRDKCDKSIFETAVREFYEETLCANSSLRVINSEEPFILYWFDRGQKWEYQIYVATVDEPFYFSFNPQLPTPFRHGSDMADNDVAKNSESFNGLVMQNVSRTTDYVYNCVAVIHWKDYVNYMNQVQLKFYSGPNNYNQLFKHVDEITTISNSRMEKTMGPGPTSITNIPERTTVSVDLLKINMSRHLRYNGDVYTCDYCPNAYKKSESNERAKRCWKRYWRLIDSYRVTTQVKC